jgi:hypothetical protein
MAEPKRKVKQRRSANRTSRPDVQSVREYDRGSARTRAGTDQAPAPGRPGPTSTQLEAAIEGARSIGQWHQEMGIAGVPRDFDQLNPAEETGGPRGAGYPPSDTTGGPVDRKSSRPVESPGDLIASNTSRKSWRRADKK